jgi:hypothetical protein
MITPEEETILAQRIKMGDQKALERLTTANLRFVVSVAKQYQHQGLSLSDLINEGNLGLIKAAQRFDETKGFKFISFSAYFKSDSSCLYLVIRALEASFILEGAIFPSESILACNAFWYPISFPIFGIASSW